MLMKSAVDLALSLRSCCAEYDWSQTVPPLSLNKKDIKHIDGYDIGKKGKRAYESAYESSIRPSIQASQWYAGGAA